MTPLPSAPLPSHILRAAPPSLSAHTPITGHYLISYDFPPDVAATYYSCLFSLPPPPRPPAILPSLALSLMRSPPRRPPSLTVLVTAVVGRACLSLSIPLSLVSLSLSPSPSLALCAPLATPLPPRLFALPCYRSPSLSTQKITSVAVGCASPSSPILPHLLT